MTESETPEAPKPASPKKAKDKEKKKPSSSSKKDTKEKALEKKEEEGGDKEEEGDESSSSKAAKKEKKKKKKKDKKKEEEGGSSDTSDDPPQTCLSKFKAHLPHFKKKGVSKDKDSKKSDDSEAPPATSGRHSSVVSQEIDSQLQRMEAEKNKKVSIGERLIYVFCCVYCRAPDITPEETPEERERREKIEKLLEQREVEMKRLECERLAGSVKTVMYCKNAVYEPVEVVVEEEVDGEVLGEVGGEEEGGEGGDEQQQQDRVGTAPKSVVVVPVEEQTENVEGEQVESKKEEGEVESKKEEEVEKKEEEKKPERIDPQQYLYENAHNHNFATAFEPSPVNILISDYHTPSSAAAEYYSALISYTSTLLAQRAAMAASAVKIQSAERTRLAKIRFAFRQVEKSEENRLEELAFTKERDTWISGYDLYLGMVHKVAKRFAHVTTNYWKIPAASTIIQKHFRRYRVALRFPNFRSRVLAQRKRRLERSRYLDALEMAYGNRFEKNRAQQQHIERIKYSRASRDLSGFTDDRGGWKPDYDATTDVDIWTHIWRPPEGSQFGVRNLKVKVPPESHAEASIIKSDKNAWVGVPVICVPVKKSESVVGPPKRDFFDTMKKYSHVKSKIPKPSKKMEAAPRKGVDKYYSMKYNWIPAHMVSSSIVDSAVSELSD